MKKIICSLLAILMLASLCACGSTNDSSSIRGEIIHNTTPVETEPAETEPAFSFGKTTGTTYKNDFLGLSCTLPSDWEYYSEQQMMEMNNLVGDYLDEDVAAQIENAAIIYDMMASSADGGSININLEKLSATQLLALDIQAVLDAQKDMIITAYENIGYTDVQVTSEKVTVDGQEFDGMAISANFQGLEFFAKAFAFSKGRYLANVTVCSMVADNTATYLSYFTVE